MFGQNWMRLGAERKSHISGRNNPRPIIITVLFIYAKEIKFEQNQQELLWG